jgi:hypothetical protein
MEGPELSLKFLWKLIEIVPLVSKYEPLLRRLDHRYFHSPIDALIFCIDLGIYPPPEILLSIKKSWQEYLSATGTMTLEDAFLGKSVRKGGNFARRSKRRKRNLWLAILLLAVRRENPSFSQNAAADFAVREYELDIDPETLLREVRFASPKVIERMMGREIPFAADAAVIVKRCMDSRRKNKRLVIPVKND